MMITMINQTEGSPAPAWIVQFVEEVKYSSDHGKNKQSNSTEVYC